MRSLILFFIIVFFFASAFLLFAYSVAGMPENPNDLSDTSGIPAAYMFATLLGCAGTFSLIASFVSLATCRVIGDSHIRTRFTISFIANIPLLLSSVFGAFSVAAFSSDSLIGILSGLLFVSIFCIVCVRLFQVISQGREWA
ncbi:hypothetical protein [Pseudomonas syringae]|uniref:hypothetical protein n=1 Tax=Pseudomonas syringae TaxID=317 RepID=UPI0011C3A6F7|nr:hypothetical protein [Pseudomonas azotoformans]